MNVRKKNIIYQRSPESPTNFLKKMAKLRYKQKKKIVIPDFAIFLSNLHTTMGF